MYSDSLAFDRELDPVETNCRWLISSDKIFSGPIEDFKDFTEFLYLDFQVAQFGAFDGNKYPNSIVQANDVKIYIRPGIYCTMLLGKMSTKTVLKKITLMKIAMISGKTSELEKMEFNQCVIKSFSRLKNIICFAFQYCSFSYSCTDYDTGVKQGSSAVSVDMAKWDVKES